MEDYELTIAAIQDYKNRACGMIRSNCDKCEALHECVGKQYCAFDTVVRFIEYANKYMK